MKKRDYLHMRKNILLSYFLALLVIFIWSITFVSTKILLNHISPTEILFYRNVIAYLIFFAVSPRIIWPRSFRDEVKFALAGLLGVTLYFLCENFALSFSTAANVSLLVSTAPMLTGLVSHFLTKDERITKYFIYGGLFGLAGVFLIVFNGHFYLKLNPTGDILAILSALSFAFYSIIIRDLDRTVYSAIVITRKTFFIHYFHLYHFSLPHFLTATPKCLFKEKFLGTFSF